MPSVKSVVKPSDTTAPFLLPWTPGELDEHHRVWGANCGPCSLAAATGRTLAQIRAILPDFRGYMNPAHMDRAIVAGLKLPLSVKPRLRTATPCHGLNRVQWEGPWLDAGVHPGAAYAHTHWIAHVGGWVLCTGISPNQWITLAEWTAALTAAAKPWHLTHHYFFDLTPIPTPAHVTAHRAAYPFHPDTPREGA